MAKKNKLSRHVELVFIYQHDHNKQDIQYIKHTYVLTGMDWMEVCHSISNRFIQCFSDKIDRVNQNSPSMQFRRANMDSGGPIGIQEG